MLGWHITRNYSSGKYLYKSHTMNDQYTLIEQSVYVNRQVVLAILLLLDHAENNA